MVPGLDGLSTSEERRFKKATVEAAVNLLSLKASVLEKNICDRAPETNENMMSYLEMKNCTITGRHQSSCLNKCTRMLNSENCWSSPSPVF